MNREIGYAVRAGNVGNVQQVDGKAPLTKVVGEIIQSYTPMNDYDHELIARWANTGKGKKVACRS